MPIKKIYACCAVVFLQYAIILSSILLLALPAFPFDYAAPFVDPLQTLPKILRSGAILPGDDKPVACPAGKDFSSPLTLAEAVDLALCNNPQIKAAWASIRVQSASAGEARAAYLPKLSGGISFMRTHHAYPGSNIASATTDGNTIYGTLSWQLFDFGGRDADRKSANSLLVAAITHHDAVMQKILADVIQAYFDALTARAGLLAKEQNEDIARNTLETAQRKEARGAVARSDTLQAATALAKASLDRNRAIGDYDKAVALLVYTLGVPPQTRIILPDDLGDNGAADLKSMGDWLKTAAESHPAILSARAQLESSILKIISTRSESLPTLDFSASYYQNGYPGQGLSPTDSQVSTIGFFISFPFFDGFSGTYKIRGAEARAEQLKAELKDTEYSTLMEVVKAYADATASLRNLQASETLLDAALESLSTSQRKYDKGAADILELLNAQSAFADAKQERIRSLAEWNSARLRLLASAGSMGREALVRQSE